MIEGARLGHASRYIPLLKILLEKPRKKWVHVANTGTKFNNLFSIPSVF